MALVLVAACLLPLTAQASADIDTPSPLQRLAEARRSAPRTADALRDLAGQGAPVPQPNGRWLVTFRDAGHAAASLTAPVLGGTGARTIARRVVLLDRLPGRLTPDALTA